LSKLTLQDMAATVERLGKDPIPTGIVANWRRQEEIKHEVPQLHGPEGLTRLGLVIVPCVHLKDEELFLVESPLSPYDVVGFINTCEALGISWRVMLAAFDFERKSR
jgi:hypothetical protein